MERSQIRTWLARQARPGLYPFELGEGGTRSPQGSAGSSPHYISGMIEVMVASTRHFRAGVYQNRLGYQNSSAAVGCSAPKSTIFAPVCVGISLLAALPKSLAYKGFTHW